MARANRNILPLPELSEWTILLFIIKTCALAKIKKQQSVAKEPKAGKVVLTAEDLINSEYFWYPRIQEEIYPDESEHLRNGEPISKNSRILMLDPFFDKDYRL